MATACTSTIMRPTTSVGFIPGAGFTIEPGLYFETFGVRTEINVFRDDRSAQVTGPRQMEIVTLTG